MPRRGLRLGDTSQEIERALDLPLEKHEDVALRDELHIRPERCRVFGRLGPWGDGGTHADLSGKGFIRQLISAIRRILPGSTAIRHGPSGSTLLGDLPVHDVRKFPIASRKFRNGGILSVGESLDTPDNPTNGKFAGCPTGFIIETTRTNPEKCAKKPKMAKRAGNKPDRSSDDH